MFNKIYVAGIKRKKGVPDDEMLTQVVHVHTLTSLECPSRRASLVTSSFLMKYVYEHVKWKIIAGNLRPSNYYTRLKTMPITKRWNHLSTVIYCIESRPSK